jgi:hypothetical protein
MGETSRFFIQTNSVRFLKADVYRLSRLRDVSLPQLYNPLRMRVDLETVFD